MRVSNDTSSNQVSSAEAQSTSAAAKAKKAERATAAAGAPSAAVTSDESTANISARARDMAKAKAIASETPDVRDDKVAELRKRISEGKYNVDSHKVASKMIDDHLKSDIG